MEDAAMGSIALDGFGQGLDWSGSVPARCTGHCRSWTRVWSETLVRKNAAMSSGILRENFLLHNAYIWLIRFVSISIKKPTYITAWSRSVQSSHIVNFECGLAACHRPCVAMAAPGTCAYYHVCLDSICKGRLRRCEATKRCSLSV